MSVFTGLEKAYYQQDFDPMLYELSTLPAAFNTENLEELAIERTAVLEVAACFSALPSTSKVNSLLAALSRVSCCRWLVSC